MKKDLNEAILDLQKFGTTAGQRWAKEFKKLSKKMDGSNPDLQEKRVLKFVKEKLTPFWKKHIEDVVWEKDDLNVLEERILHTYLFGVFVISNSVALRERMNESLKRTAEEIDMRIKDVKKKRGL